jgi:hypothetical protein
VQGVRYGGASTVTSLRTSGEWVEVVARDDADTYSTLKRSFTGGAVTSGIDFANTDAEQVGALTFNDAGESVSVATNAITVTSSTVLLNEGSPATISTITANYTASGRPFLLIRNAGSDVTFTNSSTIRLPGGEDLTLSVNESVCFYNVTGNTWQYVGLRAPQDSRGVADQSGSVVVSNSGTTTLFDAGTNGAVWRVYVMHTGGQAGASALIVGDASAPQVEDLINDLGDGGVTTTIGVSGTDIT